MTNKIDDGGHAFPIAPNECGHFIPGLTKLEVFAGLAMVGLLACPMNYKLRGTEVISESEYARTSCALARTLIAALKEGEGKRRGEVMTKREIIQLSKAQDLLKRALPVIRYDAVEFDRLYREAKVRSHEASKTPSRFQKLADDIDAFLKELEG